jgi:hypothetical protein
MPAVALRDMQLGATDEGLVSRRRARSTIASGVSSRDGTAVRVRDECDLLTHSFGRDDSSPRLVGAALFSVVVRVAGRVERRRGYCGA